MARFSTRQAARSLGISHETLAHYIEVGKVPSPEVFSLGKGQRAVHAWTEEEIEHVRKLLPKIANGRKTRYKKLRDKQNAPAGVPALRKHGSRKQKRSKKK
jgi:predicted DNA-binding transcriptional regulator AlpA